MGESETIRKGQKNYLKCNTPKYTLAVFELVYGILKAKLNFSGNKTKDPEFIIKPRVN